MHRGGALRHPDCSAPRLGSRFAVGTGRLCQIKFWLMQVMGFAEDDEVWQAYLATPPFEEISWRLAGVPSVIR